MMAHVAYPCVDENPAGYSRVWIEDILRDDYGFGGVVFSDDISMVAAESAGGIAARIVAHRDAGCDLILVCKPDVVPEALEATKDEVPCAASRIAMLCGGVGADWQALEDNPQRGRFVARLATLGAQRWVSAGTS